MKILEWCLIVAIPIGLALLAGWLLHEGIIHQWVTHVKIV